ncbi:MAG: phosphopentomutase [Culicoidibacterales bacterium]
MNIKRAMVIVLDSVGIGEAKDAAKFNDFGVDTLGNISKTVGLNMPNMAKLGLGNINEIETVPSVETTPNAYYTHMEPIGAGKDSVAGHWEFMGADLEMPFNNFCAEGFPKELIDLFEKETGLKVIGNKEANGMKIIEELASEQEKTGALIVYTSVDSTFQIAAHEEWIGLEKLYSACEVARRLTLENPQWMVSRVIARPYIGSEGKYTRTGNRHDYALDPFKPIALTPLKDAGLDVISIGKIKDLYNGVGITESIKSESNEAGIQHIIDLLNRPYHGLGYANLVDFDSVYGHPRNPEGYRDALEYFDAKLPEILDALQEDDVLFITADHGNDPTYKGNDHTRENVPLIVYSKQFKNSGSLPARHGFMDLGKTITDIFDVSFESGISFKELLK